MRLLGIIAVFVLTGCAFAGETTDLATDCTSPDQQELMACISARADSAEDRLRQAYAKAESSIDTGHRQDLGSSQGHWRKFRDSYCQSVYDEISPGREAPIERQACREQLALDRIAELYFVSVGPSGEFPRILRALEGAGYERDELVARLDAMYADEETWVQYVSVHCELLGRVAAADEQLCRARMNFERSY
ncbi:lysozyme inhibitor LprI family protein [Lysobacter sp. F60174L2]|uniref:lysozyme inhibitor LprI family protein n=1 Tax=Lysobacter sp. F60174L2 TaxID=3459295 RepID=UPI00403DD9AC